MRRVKVLFDSENKAVGRDYSRWNDVWLTLRADIMAPAARQKMLPRPNSTVMYVAAPIISDGRITSARPVCR